MARVLLFYSIRASEIFWKIQFYMDQNLNVTDTWFTQIYSPRWAIKVKCQRVALIHQFIICITALGN